MDGKKTLHICMGTGCHSLGVHDVVGRLRRLLEAEGLDQWVEMRGSFCNKNCQRGIYMQLDDVPFGHIRPGNIENVFREQVRPMLP